MCTRVSDNHHNLISWVFFLQTFTPGLATTWTGLVRPAISVNKWVEWHISYMIFSQLTDLTWPDLTQQAKKFEFFLAIAGTLTTCSHFRNLTHCDPVLYKLADMLISVLTTVLKQIVKINRGLHITWLSVNSLARFLIFDSSNNKQVNFTLNL